MCSGMKNLVEAHGAANSHVYMEACPVPAHRQGFDSSNLRVVLFVSSSTYGYSMSPLLNRRYRTFVRYGWTGEVTFNCVPRPKTAFNELQFADAL